MGRLLRMLAVALALVGCLTAASYLVWPRVQKANEPEAPEPQQAEGDGAHHFRNWPKPEVALVLTGEGHGYIQPCGCSEVQHGGLARRFNLIDDLTKKRGWSVVGLDLGDMAQESSPQRFIKYRYYMEALNRMPYAATTVGKREFDMSLLNALGEFSLNNPKPRVLISNLKNREQFGDLIESTMVVPVPGSWLKLGVLAIVADSVAKQVQDPQIQFEDEDKAIPAAVAAFKQKPDFLVLLYQGTQAEAQACAAKHPQFHVILAKSDAEEPNSVPKRVGGTMIVEAGHRGRYVVVVGVNGGQGGKPFELRRELVPILPNFDTPKGQDAQNPVHALLQQYAQEVKDKDYLKLYPSDMKHEVQIKFPNSKYVGSERCESCHDSAYKVWQTSGHSHAYQTLEKRAERPNLRQYDGECVKCHVIGFTYATGFRNERDTIKLKGVGCESCHGPSSLHTASPNNMAIRQAINPWKHAHNDQMKIENMIGDMCFKCHDTDNSVNFKFQRYWKKVEHPNPPAAQVPAGNAPPPNAEGKVPDEK